MARSTEPPPPGARLRIATARPRDVVTSVALAPDARTLATGAFDGAVDVWELDAMAPRASYALRDPVIAVGHRRDGAVVSARLRAGDAGRGPRVLLAAGAETYAEVDPREPLGDRPAACFSPDGSRLALGAGSHAVLVIDAARGARVRRFDGHRKDVTALAFSPDGALLASGGRDKSLVLWDVASGDRVRRFACKGTPVHAAAFSPDGAMVASAVNHYAQAWSVRTGKAVQSVQVNAGAMDEWALRAVAFGAGGTLVACGRAGLVLDLATGRLLRRIEAPGAAHVVPTPDGARVVTASAYAFPTLIAADVATGRRTTPVCAHEHEVTDVAVAPDGRAFVTVGGDDRAFVWDAATGALVRAVAFGGGGNTNPAAYAPDGSRFAVGDAGGAVTVFSAADGATALRAEGGANLSALAFTPDGARLVCAGSAVRVVDAKTGRRLWESGSFGSVVSSVAVSPDGAAIAAGVQQGTVRLFDAVTGKPGRSVACGGLVMGVAFTPDGRELVWGGTEGVGVCDAATLAPRARTGGGAGAHAVAVSPDGRTIASGATAPSKHVALWDRETLAPRATFEGHASWVRRVAFLPDGRSLVSVAEDGAAIVWSLRG